METLEAIRREPALAKVMVNPFSLAEGFKGPKQPHGQDADFDDWADAWTGPFVMATINTKNIHRSNALRGHPWGEDFVYSEKMLTGKPGQGDKGRKKAHALARFTRLQNLALGFTPTRALLRRFVLTQPGDGPDAAAREAGRYEVWFTGQSAGGERLRAIVKGDRTCACIAAASIIAKVTRDRIMTELDQRYPEYGFAAHKGYGTAAHTAALERYGPTPEHRRSFRPERFAQLDLSI